jgi:general secretion pathway protein K
MLKQQGVALVLVLWMLSLMTIMAGSFALSMRRQISIVEGVKYNAVALAQAESGIALAETMLMIADQNKRWRTDGNVYQIDYANSLTGTESKVRVRMFSETGKIDINKADQVLLQAIMTHAPVEEDQQTKLISAIIDWRDQDDLINISGAEKKEYKEAGLSYQPRNKPFQNIEELQLVLGVTEEVYQWLEPLITVNSGQLQVDVRQASMEVLQVLPNLDANLTETFIQARKESASKGLPVPAFSGGTGQESAPSEQNGAITIVSEAQLSDGSSAAVSVMVTKSQDNLSTPFKVLRWQRNSIGNQSLFNEEMSQLLVAEYAEPEFNN